MGDTEVTLFWRPGCPFCGRLERALARAGVELPKRNIWADPDAAAIVRSWASGNETVPTVVVGPVGLVNPRPEQVVVAMREHAPELLPETLR